MGLSQKRPSGDITDEKMRLHVESIQEDALGNIIPLSAAPTASAPLLEDNQIGSFENILYFRKGSNIEVVTPSSTIAIT